MSSFSTVRVPDELYKSLREIKVSLESQHLSAAPSIQDLVVVALGRFIHDWNNPLEQEKMTGVLLANRKEARSRMGKKKL